MATCLPGCDCYPIGDVIVYKTYPAGCTSSSPSPTTLPISSDNLYYSGANLPYTAINTYDTITTALQKIDAKLSDQSIFALFVQAIDTYPALKTIFCSKVGTCP